MQYLTSNEYINSREFKKQEFAKEAVLQTLKTGIELVLAKIIKELEDNEGIPAIASYKQILTSENFSDNIFIEGEIPEYYAKQILQIL